MVLPSKVPVMTLPNATLFPQALLPLYIFERRYRQMLQDALRTHRMFIVAMQKPGWTRESPCPVAGLGLIRVAVDHPDGTSHLVLQGLSRVELGPTRQYSPYRVHTIRPLQPEPVDNSVIDDLLRKLHQLVEQRLKFGPFPYPFPDLKASLIKKGKSPGKLLPKFSAEEILRYLQRLPDAAQVADLVSCALLAGARQRQAILETVDIEARLRRLIRFLNADIQRNPKKNPSK